MRRRATASAAAPSPRAARPVEALEPRRLLAVTVLGSFDAGLGELNSIAFDPASGNVFVHASHAAEFREFTPAGVEVAPAIPAPGLSSNDGDLDFAPVATSIDAAVVPAGSLLYFNGDDSPPTVYALDKNDGRVIASNPLPIGSVGGSLDQNSGHFFNVDYPSDTIQVIDPDTETELARFPVTPQGAPAFDVFFGDVDVLASSGNAFVVSDSQPIIRELTPAGAYVGDIDLTNFNVARLTGIAFDDARGEAWVSSRDGTVFRLGGFTGAGIGRPGTLDQVKAVNIPGPTPQANDLVTLDGGKILAVGTAVQNSNDIALFRLNADGTLDTTFGTGGGVTFLDLTGGDADEDARALALQPDGKIIVVGTINEANGGSNYFVARFNPDGTLDTTFGDDGGFNIADFAAETGAPPGAVTHDRGTAVTVRPDGGIVVAGVTDALDPNGDFAMVAYRADGSDDPTFGGNGTTKNGSNKLVTPFAQAESANAIAVQGDGKIVIGGQVTAPGSSNGTFGVLRLNADGSLDTTFGTGGLVTTDLRDGGDGVTSLLVQGDGKVVAGGFATTGAEGTDAFDSDFGLVRYNADGSLDATFGSNGIVLTDVPGQIAAVTQLAMDAGDNLVAAGRAAASQSDLQSNQLGAAVARYKPNGALDTAFGTGGILVISFATLTASSLRAGASSLVAAAIQNPGADAAAQQALIALSAQGKLNILLTAGGEVRLATVTGDAGAPTATIALLPSVTDLGLPAQTFVVEYADDLAIDVSTLGNGDILVSGPGVTDQPAELVGVDNNANGTPRRATYRFVAPGGAGFTAAQNGTYQLSIAADQVKDASGFSLAAGPVTNATFTVNINADAANLVAGALTGKFPASVVGGGKAGGASVLVTNNGTQPAVGTIAIRLVASTDGTVDDADAEIVTVNQKVNLKPGKAKALKLKFKTFPANLPDGDYFLLARIDSANAIPEAADTLDNVAAAANTIRIAAPFVDLGFAGGITGFKSPLAPGKNGTLAVPLRNNGNIPAKATVSANLFASLDQAMSGDDRSLGTVPVKASLKAGTTKNTKLKFTLPADLAPGQYFLILVLNPTGNDRDTGDNAAVSAIPLTVG